mgnify:CR=1 FL=1
MFDANVFGTMRVTQTFLPALRAARGAVVNISSVAGRMVFPESGFYAASKYAVEAWSEALYLEHAAAGVRVTVVEPGAFDTEQVGQQDLRLETGRRIPAEASAAPPEQLGYRHRSKVR